MPKILKESQRRETKTRRKREQQTDGVNRKQRNQSRQQLFKYEWIKHFIERQRLLGYRKQFLNQDLSYLRKSSLQIK